MQIIDGIIILVAMTIIHYITLYIEIKINSDLFYDLYIKHDFKYKTFKKIINKKEE